MSSPPASASPAVAEDRKADVSRIAGEGVVAGVIGAGTIALWFFILDLIKGRPLYTPTVLGTFFFKGKAALGTSADLPVSMEMVVLFTWLHVLVFLVIGGFASRLVKLAEKNPDYGFGIILLFVMLLYGFQFICIVFAEEVLRALAWPAILVGNLLAAGTMGTYLWKRHPNIKVLP